MTCLVCERKAHPRKSAHGLCLGHALLFLYGPFSNLEQFILWRERI